MYRWRCAIACVLFGAFGCSGPVEPAGPAGAVQTFKRNTAEHLAAVLSDAPTREQLLSELRQRGPLALAEFPTLLVDAGTDLGSSAVPEIWLREPAGASDSEGLLIAYAPAGNERTWTEIPAYTLGGARVSLDPRRAPDAPVLVIETHGRLAMRKGIEEANLALQRAGLQLPTVQTASLTGDIPTTRLDSIRLQDDCEPWISGAAEIYALVSGVLDASNSPQVKLVDMPYLDYDGTTYRPNQIVVDWTNYAYQAVNIQLFEHDDNTNYQDLVTAIVSAIGAAGSLAGYPVVSAITEIANRIIAAIPSSAFTNDDDYVDSFYTVEKTRTYTGLVGARGNATVSLSPYLLLAN
jgi:hypothetical protein